VQSVIKYCPLEVMLTCVRWYIAYPLSYRHIEELMQERGVSVDHTTVDIMVTDVSETLWQARQHPELCSVSMEKPLQFAEKAYMLPRDDLAFKAWIDNWMHMQKMNGTYDAVFKKWLK
jgi:Bacterial extracellular solute-binding proteins, family 3